MFSSTITNIEKQERKKIIERERERERETARKVFTCRTSVIFKRKKRICLKGSESERDSKSERESKREHERESE